jgi:hypothetical protein
MSSMKTDKDGNVTGPKISGAYVQIGAVRHYGFDTAITANTTVTTAPAGSQATTTHATGRGKLFVSDGAKWQFAAIS